MRRARHFRSDWRGTGQRSGVRAVLIVGFAVLVAQFGNRSCKWAMTVLTRASASAGLMSWVCWIRVDLAGYLARQVSDRRRQLVRVVHGNGILQRAGDGIATPAVVVEGDCVVDRCDNGRCREALDGFGSDFSGADVVDTSQPSAGGRGCAPDPSAATTKPRGIRSCPTSRWMVCGCTGVPASLNLRAMSS